MHVIRKILLDVMDNIFLIILCDNRQKYFWACRLWDGERVPLGSAPAREKDD